jgi:hypothetical protein
MSSTLGNMFTRWDNKNGTIFNIHCIRILNWWIYAAHLHFDTIPRHLAAFGGVAFS